MNNKTPRHAGRDRSIARSVSLLMVLLAIAGATPAEAEGPICDGVDPRFQEECEAVVGLLEDDPCENDQCDIGDPCENPEDCEKDPCTEVPELCQPPPDPCENPDDCEVDPGPIPCVNADCPDPCEDPDTCHLPPVDTYDPMEIETQCSKIMMLCVFAGADMHLEAVDNAPNPAVHMTTGGGHNSNFVDAKVDVKTTLGDASRTLGPDQGVAWTWSDMSHVGDCKYDYVEARATGYIPLGIPVPVPLDYWTPAEAHVFDGICETTGE